MSAINVDKATDAYIQSLGAEALEKSANYTAGNHWLILAGLLVSALVTWLIVRSGLLGKIEKRFSEKKRGLGTYLTCAAFFLISSLLTLPYNVYTEWARLHSYDLSDQPLGDFLMQGAMGTAISALLGGLFFMGIYALIRRTGKRWWLWSGGLAAGAILVVQLAVPSLIAPLFNDYSPLPDGPVRAALEEMAAEAGIPADRIFVYDGSRQSNNFTANVAGIGSSARIAISDVALTSASLDEVKAVTGHEIGHYVLGHVWRSAIILPLLAMLLFFLADHLYPRFARLFGSDARLEDARSIPVLLFIVSLFGILATPVLNGLTRMGEREADQYSLENANLPDALASALVKTAEYRYPYPHPVEEFLFYTHPSVEWRVRNAMEWKAAQAPSESQNGAN